MEDNSIKQQAAENSETIRKTIPFTLVFEGDSREITITYYINEGYDRRYVTMLFEKLQALGYGEFLRGKKGRGFVAKFVANKKCPEVYILEVEQKKRGRKGSKHVVKQ